MRRTLIALIAAAPLAALGVTAFAAQPTSGTKDDLFLKADGAAPAATEKAEPLKGVNIKSLRLEDDSHGLNGEHGESGEGMDD